MIVEYIKGSILDTTIKYIAHGVNCQNKMGSGVAKVLYKSYPEVKEWYHEFCDSIDIEHRLGKVMHIPTLTLDDKKIINCFTQYDYGYDGKRYVNYWAIGECFKKLAKDPRINELAIPKIGSGLAGGDWDIISQIINDATGDDLNVYVYYLEDK